jgi:hypothetical protein
MYFSLQKRLEEIQLIESKSPCDSMTCFFYEHFAIGHGVELKQVVMRHNGFYIP